VFKSFRKQILTREIENEHNIISGDPSAFHCILFHTAKDKNIYQILFISNDQTNRPA
jgi:hypothetical protein